MEENTKFYVIVGLFAIITILFGIFVFTQDTKVQIPSDIKLVSDNTLQDHIITVTGSAEQKVAPNETYIYFTIETKAKDAKTAQTKNAETWDKLKLEFKNKDYLKYQTEGYNVWPDTQWDEKLNKSITIGYIVRNSIKVTLTDLTQTGKTLDTIVTNDINNIDSISFGLSTAKQNEIKQSLWKTAVDDAKTRAETVANAAGTELLATPKSIVLNEYNYTPYPYRYDYAMSAKGAYDTEQAANTEVTPQELNVSVSLTLVYEYK